MAWTSSELWLAIAAISALTYLSRVLPFVFGSAPVFRPASPAAGVLSILGPALLAALGAATVVPGFVDALKADRGWIFLLGASVTVVATLWRREPGLAVLAGIATFYACITVTGG